MCELASKWSRWLRVTEAVRLEGDEVLRSDALGTLLIECPLCGAVGLAAETVDHDCPAFVARLRRRTVGSDTPVSVTTGANVDDEEGAPDE